MESLFCSYEQALALKELGFDEPCFASYSPFKPYSLAYGYYTYGNCIAAPLYQQAFSFFREKHNLHAEPYTTNMGAIEYCFQIRDLYSERYIYANFFAGPGSSYMGTFNTPEEAELACLIKLIEIVKKK